MASSKSTMIVPKFRLENGTLLLSVSVAFKTWGSLNARCDNVVVVCHPFTASVDVDEWWAKLFGRGRALDPAKMFIVCMNILGSAYGSASPLSVDASGRCYGPDFPDTTIRDDVRIHKIVLDRLGVSSIAVVIGGSMGGMHALEWPLCFPGFVKRVVAMATCARQSAWCIGWSEAQRQAIFSDGAFEDGWYHDYGRQPTAGLAAARMAGMLTYRSRDSFEARFGRMLQGASDEQRPVFSAQSYLRYKGAKFSSTFDANCYIHITHKMDTHDIARERASDDLDHGAAIASVLSQMPPNALIVSIDTDGLCLPEEQRMLAEGMPNAQLVVIESLAGHDGFLVESEQINGVVLDWLREEASEFYQAVSA
ncbi:Alpha/Beta hydrolase protein [Roridomyces roridus]|uniref:Alpha/Beta hydrolase protein n=1 Tax=Roridomyces roridus TaxID=1738132 RepID=A0AAD7BBQ3_9AGAR|nr:Alpha/Beta hydrolase protein [Roridomyces roridus]